jgi:hypothetical protein
LKEISVSHDTRPLLNEIFTLLKAQLNDKQLTKEKKTNYKGSNWGILKLQHVV